MHGCTFRLTLSLSRAGSRSVAEAVWKIGSQRRNPTILRNNTPTTWRSFEEVRGMLPSLLSCLLSPCSLNKNIKKVPATSSLEIRGFPLLQSDNDKDTFTS